LEPTLRQALQGSNPKEAIKCSKPYSGTAELQTTGEYP
jgi:hypothetical protein